MGTDTRVVELLRETAPQVLAKFVARYGQLDACEDALQEALLAAAMHWPEDGIPDSPRAWLSTVAARRLTDQWRSDQARRRREVAAAALESPRGVVVPGADELAPDRDDTLTLLFLCCHPTLSPATQIALTLRAVGGLTTAQIARAFLVPEATIAQRISRAKQRIKAAGASFQMPSALERPARLRVVLHVLYLIFNEGYATTSGPDLQCTELTQEAIRLTRMVHELLPDDGEVAGLLALMLLTDARSPARTRSDGTLVPLSEQDRRRWKQAYIKDGVALITRALADPGTIGQYQLQAAIAAIHAEAPRAEDTDWPQILALYQLLDRVAPNPVVTLGQAVALAMVKGPQDGLALLATLDTDKRMPDHHRLHAVRAHLLEMMGERAAARECYRLAARRTTSIPEQRYLAARVAQLADEGNLTPATARG